MNDALLVEEQEETWHLRCKLLTVDDSVLSLARGLIDCQEHSAGCQKKCNDKSCAERQCNGCRQDKADDGGDDEERHKRESNEAAQNGDDRRAFAGIVFHARQPHARDMIDQRNRFFRYVTQYQYTAF